MLKEPTEVSFFAIQANFPFFDNFMQKKLLKLQHVSFENSACFTFIT